MIGDAENHNWPLSGGTLDQTASFYEAYKFYRTAVALIEQRKAQRK